jgi:hypothetical protein
MSGEKMITQNELTDEMREILSKKGNLITNLVLDELALFCNTEIDTYGEFAFFSLKTLYMINSAILMVVCEHLQGSEGMFEGLKKMIFEDLEYEESKKSLEVITHKIQ